MFDPLTERPDPILYFIGIFPLLLIALALGYLYSLRYSRAEDDKAGWAFGLGQAAIFGLIALILGFSFSFAAGRFEARRALENGRILQGKRWGIASRSARRDPYYLDLSRSVIDTIAVADQQEAALNNHVPRAIIGIILLCTLVGAFLLGLTFGRAKAPNALLSALFCLLFAATVFTIIDLDHPQGGFIGVDVAPLQWILDDMTKAPESKLMWAPVTTQGEPSYGSSSSSNPK